jgi:hypothetical protein
MEIVRATTNSASESPLLQIYMEVVNIFVPETFPRDSQSFWQMANAYRNTGFVNNPVHVSCNPSIIIVLSLYGPNVCG